MTRLSDVVLQSVSGELGPDAAVVVAAEDWLAALSSVKRAGAIFFDFLTGVDSGTEFIQLVAHVATPEGTERLTLVTQLTSSVVDSATGIYPGANWHERETAEMFGVAFAGHPRLDPLLLGVDFVGHPLRKDFALAARATRPWPGLASDAEAAPLRSGGRRRVPPAGVPATWEVPNAD